MLNDMIFLSEFADCLCDLGRFREATTIYARVFSNKQTQIPNERLRHFIKVSLEGGCYFSRFTTSG